MTKLSKNSITEECEKGISPVIFVKMEVKMMGKGFNYKYDGLIARAKITEMMSKVQCEVAKQQKNCYKDRENMFENGIPANHLDAEYKNLTELYDELDKILDNFR